MSARSSKRPFIDRVVGYVSPVAAVRRQKARAMLDLYAHGSGTPGYTGRKTSYGMRHTKLVGDDTDYSLEQLRTYSRSLIAYTTIGAGAVFINSSNTIGTGLKMQPQMLENILPLSKSKIDDLQIEVKQRWRMWAQTTDCDYHGMFTFNQLQFLAYLSKLASGDVLVTLPLSRSRDTVSDLKIQLIDATRIKNPAGERNDAKRIINGVKLDRFGRPKGVYVYASEQQVLKTEAHYVPFIGAKSKRQNALLVYTPKKANEYRGKPFLAPAIETIKKIDRFIESEITATEINSLFGLFVETPSGDPTSVLGKTPITKQTDPDETPPPDYSLEPGVVLYGKPGEKVQSFDPKRPNSTFGEFIKSNLILIGMGLQIPYEILVQFFSSSYSAGKAAQNEHWKTVRRDRNDFALFCQKIYEEWFAEEVVQGRLDCPGFFDDIRIRRAYTNAAWVGTAPGQINPAVEIKAALNRINGKVSSRKKEAAALGFDFDDVISDLHEEKQEMERLGLWKEEEEMHESTMGD